MSEVASLRAALPMPADNLLQSEGSVSQVVPLPEIKVAAQGSGSGARGSDSGPGSPARQAQTTDSFGVPASPGTDGSASGERTSKAASVPIATTNLTLQPIAASSSSSGGPASPGGVSLRSRRNGPEPGVGGSSGHSRMGVPTPVSGPIGASIGAGLGPVGSAPLRLPPGPGVRRGPFSGTGMGPSGFAAGGTGHRSRSPGATGATAPENAGAHSAGHRRATAPTVTAGQPGGAAGAAAPSAVGPAPQSPLSVAVPEAGGPFRPPTTAGARAAMGKYQWDQEYQKALLDAALRLPPESVPAGFINTLSSALPPPGEGPPLEPDALALKWFKDCYPDAISTSRRDAIAVRLWLDEQLAILRNHMATAGAPRPVSAAFGVLSPAGGSGGDAPGSPKRAAAGSVSPERVKRGVGNGGSISGPAGWGAPSPTAQSNGAGAACGGGGNGGGAAPAPHFAGADSLLLLRDCEGYLDAAVVRHQETLLSRCMTELVGQVATLCVERGHMLSMLWSAMRQMLHTVLADRDAARSTATNARRLAAQATSDKADTLGRIEQEKNDMERMNELLNRRLLGAKMEAEHVRTRVAEMELELSRLRAVQPDELRKEADALRVQLSTMERQFTAAQVRLERTQAELADRDREMAAAMARMQGTADELADMREEFVLRSPRPSQPRMPPWELLTADEAELALRGLRGGVPAQDMHRLLLGVSFTGANVLSWSHLLGCCRHIDPNGPPPRLNPTPIAEEGPSSADPGEAPPAEGGSPQRLRGNKPSGKEAPPEPPLPPAPSSRATTAAGGVRRTSRAMTMGRPPPLETSNTMTSSRRTVAGAAALLPEAPGIKEQHTWLHALLSRPDAIPALSKWLPDEVVDAVAQMTNHSIDAHSIACLLLGTVSVAGTDIVPFKSLAGVLATRYHHTAADIGGSITQALELAAMSTANRVDRLQEINKELHREVVRTKRNLNTLRKVERDGFNKELRNVARKIQGRKPSPLQGFVMQKRPEYFLGLGSGDEVPACLQAEGKLYNRSMEKADAERLVNAVWQSKREFEAQQGISITLPDYLAVYLQRKYGAARAAAEAAYNLVYTLGQHQYDPDCYVFMKILMGDLDDASRDGQEALRSAVLDSLLSADSAANSGRVTGWLRKSDVREVLRNLLGAEAVAARHQAEQDGQAAKRTTESGAKNKVSMGGEAPPVAGSRSGTANGEGGGGDGGGGSPQRQRGGKAAEPGAAGAGGAEEAEVIGLPWLVVGCSSSQLDDLFDALDSEEPHEMVQYARLFEDDPDLNQGVFVETLRQQHLHNRLEWFQNIEDAVLDWAEAGGGAAVGPTALRAALLKAHPSMAPNTQRELLARVYGEAGCAVVTPPGDKPAKATGKGGKGDAAAAVPLEGALRRLRQNRTEGMCSVSQAMDLMSAGRANKGGRSSNSPRRGRTSNAGMAVVGAAGASTAGGTANGGAGGGAAGKVSLSGGGVAWADGPGAGAGELLGTLQGDIIPE